VDVLRDWKFIRDNGIVPIVSGDEWRKVLNKENVSACITLHSAVTFEEVIATLLSKSGPLFYGIRWFDTVFNTAHLSTLFHYSPYNIYVSLILKIIVVFLSKTPNSSFRFRFFSSDFVFISCDGCPSTSSILFDFITPLSYLYYIPVLCHFLPFNSKGTPQ
jgi:hypothetical protein